MIYHAKLPFIERCNYGSKIGQMKKSTCIKNSFPNISTVLSILIVTLATSGTPEKTNSALRSVKTQFRSIVHANRSGGFPNLSYKHAR